MASTGGGAPSSGRRRSLDAEINLVPFIDLLSMCICFLLMTAVWMELGGVDVKQYFGTEAPQDKKDTLEMEVRYVTPSAMEVNLRKGSQIAQSYKIDGATNDLRLTQIRSALTGLAAAPAGSKVEDVRARLAQLISVGRVTTKAGVSYGEIISVMDTLRDLGISSLGLVPVKE